MKQYFPTLTALLLVPLASSFAANPEDSAVLRRVADGVLKQTTLRLIDRSSGQTFEDSTGIAPKSEISIESKFNTWFYQTWLLSDGMRRTAQVLDEPRYRDYGEQNLKFIFRHMDYFKKQQDQHKTAAPVGDGKLSPIGFYFQINELWQTGLAPLVVERYAATRDAKYEPFLGRMRKFLDANPRFADGAFYRKGKGMMTDDPYMTVPFLVREWKRTGDARQLDDAIVQVLGTHARLFNEERGLLRHLWDLKTQKPAGEFWGRGNGWMVLAQVELLGALPADHPRRAEVLAAFVRHMTGIRRYQDKAGGWHQVLDHPESWMETSCTGMLTYGIARGVNEGWLDATFADSAQIGWKALKTKVTADGDLIDVCGSTDTGDLAYYMKRPRLQGDLHGFGSFLLAGAEIVRMPVKAQLGALFPALSVPEACGVNVHFVGARPGEIKMLAEGGFGWVRLDFKWQNIERQKGVYDWAQYDQLAKNLAASRVRILFILDYGNPLYDKGMAPSSEEGRAAFARWAASAAQHFAGQGILWEMWNEPDGEFWKPRSNIVDYVKLALATGKAIRKAAPGEAFIGPATSGGLNIPFLETCFQAGLLDYWAGVSVHLYRRSDPETASIDLRRLRLLIARYAPPGKRVPIISGEWGYSAAMAGDNAQKVGWMLPRMWLSNIANEVPLSIWYDWRDDWTDPKKPDSGNAFGVVSKAYYEKRDPVFDPKPAYLAARTLTTQLDGFAFNKRLSLNDDRDHALLFTRGDEVRLAVWTTATEPRPIVIPASSGRFRVTSYIGDAPTEISARDAGLLITLSDKPQYLVPLAPNDLLSVAAAWERLPLEITTNAPAQVNLKNRFKNPLRRAIQIIGGGPKPINLNPGASAPLALSWPVQQNAEPKLLRVELQLPGLGTLAQTTQIAVTNLLELTVLPRSGNELPVRVENPSGVAFNGSVTTTIGLGADKRVLTLPLTIGAGKTEKIVLVPLQTEGDLLRTLVQVQVLDAKGASVVSMAATEFRQVEDFARYSAGPLPFKVAQSGGPELVKEILSIASPPDGSSPAGGSLKLPYHFEQGRKYVSVVPTSDATRMIEGRPNSLGIWVWGDGSGNATRMRVTDASGQTFQFSSENIDWQGWRYITFRFNPAVYRWGGAKDGIFHWPLRFESMFLLDDVGHKSQGVIYLSSPTLEY